MNGRPQHSIAVTRGWRAGLVILCLFLISACGGVASQPAPSHEQEATAQGFASPAIITATVRAIEAPTNAIPSSPLPTTLPERPNARPSPDITTAPDAGGGAADSGGAGAAQLNSTVPNLSSLQSRVQEQIRVSYEGGAGGGSQADYCPNHQRRDATTGTLLRDAKQDWFVVGSPP